MIERLWKVMIQYARNSHYFATTKEFRRRIPPFLRLPYLPSLIDLAVPLMTISNDNFQSCILKMLRYKGNNFGYTVLAIGILISLRWSVLMEIYPNFIEQSMLLTIPFLTVNILLFSFIFSEIVRFSAQLFFYRSSH